MACLQTLQLTKKYKLNNKELLIDQSYLGTYNLQRIAYRPTLEVGTSNDIATLCHT